MTYTNYNNSAKADYEFCYLDITAKVISSKGSKTNKNSPAKNTVEKIKEITQAGGIFYKNGQPAISASFSVANWETNGFLAWMKFFYYIFRNCKLIKFSPENQANKIYLICKKNIGPTSKGFYKSYSANIAVLENLES